MAAKIDFVVPHGAVLVTLAGRVDAGTLLRMYDELWCSEQWKPGFDTIYDGRAIRELVLSPQDLDAVAAKAGEQLKQSSAGRTAVVILRDLDLMVAELFQHMLQITSGFQTFTSMKDAVEWIGLTDADLTNGLGDRRAVER